jgi:hypothetical protein
MSTEADYETYEIIAEYLERCGVEGLRQPHAPEKINKSAVIRHLIAEKLEEAMAHPPLPEGQMRRVGPGKKKKKSTPSFATETSKKRQ